MRISIFCESNQTIQANFVNQIKRAMHILPIKSKFETNLANRNYNSNQAIQTNQIEKNESNFFFTSIFYFLFQPKVNFKNINTSAV